MEVDLDTQTAAGAEPHFRPAKRRKFYRQRTGEPDEDQNGNTAAVDSSAEAQTTAGVASPERTPGTASREVQTDEYAETGLSMAEILRRRKLARPRHAGIEFTNASRSHPRAGLHESALVPQSKSVEAGDDEDGMSGRVAAVVNRFAPQTGQVTTDVNKHMMEYIETELARRRREKNDAQKASIGGHESMGEGRRTGQMSDEELEAARSGPHERQPAALGRLHEIDLGPDAMLRNIARTKAATGAGREDGDDDGDAADEGVDRSKLGGRRKKGGKPWRKRRTSEDIKRDQLVEEVLRESRLEIYDEPDPSNQDEDDQQAADDRIADQFRREFMDAVSSRQRRRANMASSTAKPGEKKDDRPKGPKLGGSRSARAAMRGQQEAAAKK